MQKIVTLFDKLFIIDIDQIDRNKKSNFLKTLTIIASSTFVSKKFIVIIEFIFIN